MSDDKKSQIKSRLVGLGKTEFTHEAAEEIKRVVGELRRRKSTVKIPIKKLEEINE